MYVYYSSSGGDAGVKRVVGDETLEQVAKFLLYSCVDIAKTHPLREREREREGVLF